MLIVFYRKSNQSIAGLDCWIDQSELQYNLVDWINPFSKFDFEFGLSIQFYHFSPNPKSSFFSREIKIQSMFFGIKHKGKRIVVFYYANLGKRTTLGSLKYDSNSTLKMILGVIT
jgi:hypothetical protein